MQPGCFTSGFSSSHSYLPLTSSPVLPWCPVVLCSACDPVSQRTFPRMSSQWSPGWSPLHVLFLPDSSPVLLLTRLHGCLSTALFQMKTFFKHEHGCSKYFKHLHEGVISVPCWMLFVPGPGRDLEESAFNYKLNPFIQFPIWFSVLLKEFELEHPSPICLGRCLEDCQKPC